MRYQLASLFAVVSVAGCGSLPDPASPAGDPAQKKDCTPLTDYTFRCDAGQTPPSADCVDEGNGLFSCVPKDAPPPDAPALNTLPASYGYATIPVRGTATPGDTVFVEGGKAPVATDAGTDGAFCLDVELTADASQTLKVFVQDSRGETSDPAQATVHYDPSLAETQNQQQPLVELAAGLVVKSDTAPSEGALSALTDDDPATSVVVKVQAVLWVDLGAEYDLESIEIDFPATKANGDGSFATQYQILAAASDTPVIPPDYQDASWTMVYDIYEDCGAACGNLPASYWEGGNELFNLPNPLRARFVAFNLIQNDMMFYDDTRMSGIKITGRSTEPLPPQPQTPTCANGKQP